MLKIIRKDGVGNRTLDGNRLEVKEKAMIIF